MERSFLLRSTLAKLKIEYFLILKVLNPLRCENEMTQTVSSSCNSRKAIRYHLVTYLFRGMFRKVLGTALYCFADHFIAFKVNYLQVYTFLAFRVFVFFR